MSLYDRVLEEGGGARARKRERRRSSEKTEPIPRWGRGELQVELKAVGLKSEFMPDDDGGYLAIFDQRNPSKTLAQAERSRSGAISVTIITRDPKQAARVRHAVDQSDLDAQY